MAEKLILLIEQDDSIREVLLVCLKHLAGWNVVSCKSSQASLELQLEAQPDAILLDTFMPKSSDSFTAKNGSLGFVQKLLIQKLRKHPVTCSTPIVLMTDKANWFTPKQLESLQVDGTIAKPFDPTTLPTQIARLLGWPSEEASSQSSRNDRQDSASSQHSALSQLISET
ncbi:MAG: response regulator [Leptodesmis sp.]|uniref:response regulator n=1 Tax=Leptodesmis sp. TaxID=3100501 RepID=UPI003D10BC14